MPSTSSDIGQPTRGAGTSRAPRPAVKKVPGHEDTCACRDRARRYRSRLRAAYDTVRRASARFWVTVKMDPKIAAIG